MLFPKTQKMLQNLDRHLKAPQSFKNVSLFILFSRIIINIIILKQLVASGDVISANSLVDYSPIVKYYMATISTPMILF